MLELFLQLFAEGGDAGASGATGTAESPAADGGFDVDAELIKRGIKPYKGRLAAAPQAEEQADAEPEPAAPPETEEAEADAQDAAAQEMTDQELEELIKGRGKGAFQRRVQGIVNERFKKSKATQAELDAVYDAIDPYMQKLGIKRGDVEGLRAAAEKDKTNFSEAAFRNGSTAEEEMAAYANKRRSAEQKAANDARQEEIRRRVAAQKNKAQYDRWRADEAEVKKTYPGFELARELSENPDFKTALEAGVPMLTAYRGAHFDELMAGVAGSAAQGDPCYFADNGVYCPLLSS